MTRESVADASNADFGQLISIAPMADEYFATYAGRVTNVLGTRSIEDLFKSVTGKSPKGWCWPDYIPLLARTASLDVDSFVRLHTSYPLNALFISDDKHFALPVSQWRAIDFRVIAAPVRHMRACPDCVTEDLIYWGVSYWRNSHQMSGIDWCPKHQTRLVDSVRSPTSACYQGPSDLDHDSLLARKNLPNRPRKLATRYMETLFGLVEARGQFTHRQLVGFLNARAASVGVQCASHMTGKTLAESIKTEFATELAWARELVRRPDHSSAFELEVASRKLFTQTRSVRHEVYALAMAVLFPSTDEALMGLIGHQDAD